MAEKKIIQTCTLCGHEYAKLFDTAEVNKHLAEAHGLYYDPPVQLVRVG